MKKEKKMRNMLTLLLLLVTSQAFAADAKYYLNGPDRGNDLSSAGEFDLAESNTVADASGNKFGVLASKGGRLSGTYAEFQTAGALSIIARVNLDGSSGDRWVAACEKQGANGRTWWKFGVNGTRGLFYGYDYGTSSHQDVAVANGVLPTSGWVTIAVTRAVDGRSLKFFINGVKVAEATTIAVPVGGSESVLYVMNDAYNLQQLNIQLVQIYTVELAENVLTQSYEQ